MRTLEETKKGLEYCLTGPCPQEECPFYENGTNGCGYHKTKNALTYIQQLEANYQQVSKALCGKENATLEEVLQAVRQVKAELEAVKRERDAATRSLPWRRYCDNCKHKNVDESKEPCKSCLNYGMVFARPNWEWRDVCPENTEVQDDGYDH